MVDTRDPVCIPSYVRMVPIPMMPLSSTILGGSSSLECFLHIHSRQKSVKKSRVIDQPVSYELGGMIKKGGEGKGLDGIQMFLWHA